MVGGFASMVFGRFLILALVCCLAGSNSLHAAPTRATGHPSTPIIHAPTLPSQPTADWDTPFFDEEDDDLLESISDNLNAAPSSAGLLLIFTASARAPGHELAFPLSRPAELLYSLRRLRI
jgi:hypothetical protein